MELIAPLLYFLGLVGCIALGAGGVSIGQGYAGGFATTALARQYAAHGPVRRALIVGLAFLESGCVFSLVITLVFLFNPGVPLASWGAMVLGAAALSMGIVACVVGAASGAIVAETMGALARQPFEGASVVTFMMIAQILLEAPTIFMFIIAFLVKSWVVPALGSMQALAYMGGCLVFAVGCIGPAIGQAHFCSNIAKAMGINFDLYPKLFSFSFIVQAMIETPIVFALLVSLMLLFSGPGIAATPVEMAALCGGVMAAIGFGSAGAAIGSGRIASRAALCMAAQPEHATTLARLAIFCQAIIDTAVIYSLIISVLLIKR